jgi:L-rhamnose-H+ transport protein
LTGRITEIIRESSGQIILFGVAICLAGIAVTGMAGMSKERELSDEQKKATIEEFNFFKGILVATFSGIMSSAFAYGLAAGKPIAAIANSALERNNGNDLWQNLPVLVVVLWGGFTTNFIWCVLLNFKNKSGGEYLAPVKEVEADKSEQATPDATPSEGTASRTVRVPLLGNYIFSAMAGVTWYLQFFFYSMGETRMGEYGFSSWTLHMASIIIFSSLWGIALHEWRGTSRRTHVLLVLGLAVLIGSTLIVGYGNYLNATPPAPH